MIMPILSISMQLEICMKARKNTVSEAIGSLVPEIRRELGLKETVIGTANIVPLHPRRAALAANRRPFATQHFPYLEKLQAQAEAKRARDEWLTRPQLAK